MNLTDDQQLAAHAAGSVVVTAGAGTGKTHMLAERFFHHVSVDGMRPIEIVAATFTDKAAAELRQRIRKALKDHHASEETIAEVDAAQISTLHALCARVCRDFSFLVGLPPDFRILLETESEVWLAEHLDDALAGADHDLIRDLGYDWLKKAVVQLLEDPYSAEKALSHTANDWRSAIAAFAENALKELTSSTAWSDARVILPRHQGTLGDRLEEYRVKAISAMSEVEKGSRAAELFEIFDGFRTNLGSARNWSEGLEEIRAVLGSLRDEFKASKEAAFLSFGDADATALERLAKLKIVFETVHAELLEHKKRDRVLDFIDLELFAREILSHPAAQAKAYYAKRWKAFLVDEFQDTNPIQAEIISLLTENARVTIVGDEKQSIYGFRRADIRVFQSVKAEIVASGGSDVRLSESFRSHDSLAREMNGIFKTVLGGLSQDLRASRKEKPNTEPPIKLAMISDEFSKESGNKLRFAEARCLAGEIKKMISSEMPVYDNRLDKVRPVKYGDISILSRKWEPVDTYIDALSAEGIPAVNAGGGKLLATREAVDAMAMLTFLSDTDDNIALAAVLRSPFFAISDRVLYDLANKKEKDEKWWHLIGRSSGPTEQARNTLTKLLELRNDLLPEELLHLADRLTGYTAVIANLPQGDRRHADWLGTLDLLRQLAANGAGDLVGTARELKTLADGRGNIPRPLIEAENAVTLASIHMSKGLEWPVVFVPDLAAETGGFGDALLIESDIGIAFKVEDERDDQVKPAIYTVIKTLKDRAEQEEEKRMLYVAVTRARDRVILTSAPVKKKKPIEFMLAGAEAAGIAREEIPFSDELSLPPSPKDAPLSDEPDTWQPAPLNTGLTAIAASALNDFAACPRLFKFRQVERHPGLGLGEARQTAIGTLTHLALEHGLTEFAQLKRLSEGAVDEYVREALQLAETFRTAPAFIQFRGDGIEKEKPFEFEHDGVSISGKADLVGADFVLDYKTGGSVHADEYRFQLWAYARAFNKPKAFVANLRDGKLFEFTYDHSTEAITALGSIRTGSFTATPAREKCSRCLYREICSDAFTETTEPEQLSLFNS